MKIDITHEALLGALVDSVRDERDHGAALMRHVLRLIAEVTKQDWFETHWRTGARLELVQLACGDMPKHWGSSAPALDVIAEAARWGLKIEQIDSERRVALMAITRLVGAERPQPSRKSASTMRTKSIAAKTKVGATKKGTATARKANGATPVRSTKTAVPKRKKVSVAKKATAVARKANGGAPVRSTKTAAPKRKTVSVAKKATAAARKANGAAPVRSTKASKTTAPKRSTVSVAKKATAAARKTNGAAPARNTKAVKTTAPKLKAVSAAKKAAVRKAKRATPNSSAKAVKTAMPKAEVSATKKVASAKAATTKAASKSTGKRQQRTALAASVAKPPSKSPKPAANGATLAPTVEGAPTPA